MQVLPVLQAAVTSTYSRDDERYIPSDPEDATATISHIARAQMAPTAESLCNGSTTATQPQEVRESALPTALVFVKGNCRTSRSGAYRHSDWYAHRHDFW